MIRFLDLKAGYTELKAEFDEAYHRVMDSGWYLLGRETEAFEEEYARYCGVKHCVSVANGLDALVLSLRAADIEAGDEIIVPSHTFIATWLAVTQVGATPVPVEPNPATYNIDVEKIEQVITPRTKAIVPVHLYGQPTDMDPIIKLADRHGLFVLEDAAQSQGAFYNRRRSGSLGNAAGHSFYPGKNLGAFSDGGAVTTNDVDLACKVRKLRNYGSQIKYQHELAGINSRTDELQAAFLRIKLKHLDQWNARRQKIASYYLKELDTAPGLVLPRVIDNASSSWHLFVVRHASRDHIQESLKQQAIETLIHYPIPAHRAQAYQHLNMPIGTFPIAEELSESVLSLPIGPHQSSESSEAIVHAIQAVTNEAVS